MYMCLVCILLYIRTYVGTLVLYCNVYSPGCDSIVEYTCQPLYQAIETSGSKAAFISDLWKKWVSIDYVCLYTFYDIVWTCCINESYQD